MTETPKHRVAPSALCAILSLAWLWFSLINHLRVEWTFNAQYSYGWFVPFLCLILAWERLKHGKRKVEECDLQPEPPAITPSLHRLTAPLLSAFYFLLFLYLPTRLFQEANPEWRFVSWSLAIITIGITLAVLAEVEKLRTEPLKQQDADRNLSVSAFQHFSVSAFLFPLCFFLVAVPWPTFIEGDLIQTLTRGNTAVTVELLNLIGIPALQHGNTIEVSSGVVGIDDACSGIRSFQATLMISLFFGDLYRLSVLRRLSLCFAGFALSFVFNVVRTTLLTTVAATQGMDAIAGWHDPAGVTILVGCFVTLWLLSLWLKKLKAEMQKAEIRADDHRRTEAPKQRNTEPPNHRLRPCFSAFQPFSLSAFALLSWLVVSEIAVEAWYRLHERNLPDPVTWIVQWPAENPTLRQTPFDADVERMLRYDEGQNVSWTESDGTRWQGMYFRWKAGSIGVHLAKSHRPEICLKASGWSLAEASEVKTLHWQDLSLPYRFYAITDQNARLHVLYCVWDDRGSQQGFATNPDGYQSIFQPVWEGRRNLGQRSLELAVWGIEDSALAERALTERVVQLLHQPTGGS
jgi:exosortase